MRHLQSQHLRGYKVLKARNDQIGHFLQEKGRTRERILTIAHSITRKCQVCENMTRTTIFVAVMTFVKKIMNDLEQLQRGLALSPR